MKTGLGLLNIANASVSAAGRFVSAEYLPSLFHGHVFWLARESWDTVLLSYEPHMAQAIRTHLSPGATFYDVGAHIGLWSLYAATITGSTGTVVSCEPSDAFTALEKNTRHIPHVELVKTAVGDRQGDAVFFGQPLSSSGSLVRDVTDINRHFSPDVPITPVHVPMHSLDLLAADRSAPDVIKVDVEGYEFKVLLGARDLIERKSPTWLIEMHPRQLQQTGDSEQDCLRLLEASGYSIEVIAKYPNAIYTIAATRKGWTSARSG